MTEGPLVLALEDLHRADPASVAILDALAGERDRLRTGGGAAPAQYQGQGTAGQSG